MTDPSSHQSGCYIRTMTASVQLKKNCWSWASRGLSLRRTDCGQTASRKVTLTLTFGSVEFRDTSLPVYEPERRGIERTMSWLPVLAITVENWGSLRSWQLADLMAGKESGSEKKASCVIWSCSESGIIAVLKSVARKQLVESVTDWGH
jgi:hypothetical protein